MKKFIIFLLFSITLSAQSWNSIVTTSISDADKIESFTDKDGVHLLVKTTSNQIKYYLLNSSGSVIRSALLSSNGDFPNIVGDADGGKIYATYQEGNYIKTKYSTNAGVSWTTLTGISIGANQTLHGVDVVRHKSKTHITWTTYNSSTHNHEVFYKRYDNRDQLGAYKNVTDYTPSEVGSFPSITASGNKIYVGYNTNWSDNIYYNEGDPKNRAKNLETDTWLPTESIPSILGTKSRIESIFATDSKLYSIPYIADSPIHSQLWIMSRDLDGSTWGDEEMFTSSYYEPTQPAKAVELENDELFVFYDLSGIAYVKFDGNEWSYSSYISSSSSSKLFAPSSAGNDIYIVMEGANYLEYRQYDANPITPQSFAGQNYNNKPKLTWEANKEPDIQYYEVWRQMRLVKQFFWDDWELLATTTSTSFTDNDIWLGGGSVNGWVRYKIRAKDKHNHLSDYTNYVQFTFYGLQKPTTQDEEQITEYALFSNYPNPFNPSTTISYQLPKESFVNLTVYNSLGQEVAVLVNETQAKGKYSVKFNATSAGGELPSGLYFYRLQCGEFNSVRKMILTK